MSDALNVSYPPYPSLYATADAVYRHLAALSVWAAEQRQVLLEVVPKSAHSRLTAPTRMAPEAYWFNAAVMHQYNVLLTVRRVRELWDKAFREFEDAWDSQAALKFRFSVVAIACDCLAEAFVSGEQQEARHSAASERILREQEALHRGFDKIINDEIQAPPPEDDPYAGWGDDVTNEEG